MNDNVGCKLSIDVIFKYVNGNNSHLLLNITQGTQYGWNADWVNYRYFNSLPANQWNVYEIPVGADWYAKYGYYPTINKIHFINDNDACNGIEEAMVKQWCQA